MARGALPSPGDTFGRYQVVRRIGRGGMGSVYEARQVDLGRAVALKVLSPELADDPVFRARFTREAQMLAALDSPHVIQVLETGDHEGALYIATQLVHGRDLMQLLRQDGPLPAAAALRVVGQVASALGDAHDAGVLHRDVKPSNVLIRESRSDYFVYLCDFGIARQTDSTHTRTGGMLGTLSYLAPECHEGADASVRSDLYSLGCVLWAVLNGRAPYERTSEYQLALAHMREEIPVYDGDSAAASQINAILRQAMAKRPVDRFDSAGTMRVALLAAEQTARGLRRPGADANDVREAPDSGKTQLRVAQPVGAGAQGESHGGDPPRGRRKLRAFTVAATAFVALVALGGTAVFLLNEDPGKESFSHVAGREDVGHTTHPTPKVPWVKTSATRLTRSHAELVGGLVGPGAAH